MAQDHDVGVGTRVDTVLVPSKIVSRIIDPHNFVRIDAVLNNRDIKEILVGEFGLVPIVRNVQ